MTHEQPKEQKPTLKLILRGIVLMGLRIVLTPFMRILLKPVCQQFYSDSSVDAIKLLFIGNSLTFTNDLPLVIGNLLKARPDATVAGESAAAGLKIHMVIQGGFTLEEHWKHKVAIKSLNNDGPWDYVVIQEQSIRVISDRASVFSHGERFAEAVRAAGSKLIVYGTWSLKDNPEANETAIVLLNELADHLGAMSVPVGRCWAQLGQSNPEIELYSDAIHPTEAGTYLAACAFFASLTGRSPEGLPNRIEKPDGELHFELPQEQANILQQTANEVVLIRR